MTDGENFYWLAGILEGEGSFMKPSPSKPGQPQIDVESKDLDVIRRVARLLGLTWRTRDRRAQKPNTSVTYHVRLTGRRAVQLMWRLRPYMCARRQAQIDRAIASYVARGSAYHPDTLGRFEFAPTCTRALCPEAPAVGSDRCGAHALAKAA